MTKSSRIKIRTQKNKSKDIRNRLIIMSAITKDQNCFKEKRDNFH